MLELDERTQLWQYSLLESRVVRILYHSLPGFMSLKFAAAFQGLVQDLLIRFASFANSSRYAIHRMDKEIEFCSRLLSLLTHFIDSLDKAIQSPDYHFAFETNMYRQKELRPQTSSGTCKLISIVLSHPQ